MKQWTNKKFKTQVFVGSYEREKSGERVFVLTGKKRRITFESWQMAKSTGWKKA